jgi:hypothetical protein
MVAESSAVARDDGVAGDAVVVRAVVGDHVTLCVAGETVTVIVVVALL